MRDLFERDVRRETLVEMIKAYAQPFMRCYVLSLVALLGVSIVWSSGAEAWWFGKKKKVTQAPVEAVAAEAGLKPAEAVLPLVNTAQPYVDVVKALGIPQKGNLSSSDQAVINRYLGQVEATVAPVETSAPTSSNALAFKVDGIPVRVPVFSRPSVSTSQPSGGVTAPVTGSGAPDASGDDAGNYLMFGNPSPAEQAILNFIARQNRRLSYQQARDISTGISEMSRSFALDPQLLTSVVAVESSFNPYAISTSGAVGLGQLKPSTAQWLGVNDPFDSRQNLYGTAKYLRFLLSKYNGSVNHALAAYYKGQGTIDRQGIDSDAQYYIGKVHRMRTQFAGI
jgi:Transglycosylase SLT domain